MIIALDFSELCFARIANGFVLKQFPLQFIHDSRIKYK